MACDSWQGFPCECGCRFDEFAILICNSNNVSDDDLSLTLNGNTLTASLSMLTPNPANAIIPGCQSGGIDYPGDWWATDRSITLAKIKELIGFDASGEDCLTGMGAGHDLNPAWLVDGINSLDVASVTPRGCGNLGTIWVIAYWTDDAGATWHGCWRSFTYQDTLPNAFTFVRDADTDYTGPVGPTT